MNQKRSYAKGARESLNKIPIVKGLPLLGNTLTALKDPLVFMVSLKKNYSDIVKIQIGGKNYFIIQKPEACRHVLQENAKNYYKPGAARMMKKFMGDGLATSNGDLWLKQRRLMQPAFHRKKIEGLISTINEGISDLIQVWKKQPSGVKRDISQAFLKLTLCNITKTMFSTDVKQDLDKIASIINDLIESASSSVTSLIKIPLSVPTPSNIRFRKANKEFEKIIYNLIERRKKENKETSTDLLDLLLHAYDDESQSYMTIKQLRDEITTIFMAGHETTAQTLSWVFYHLAVNPSLYNQVKAEATSLCNNGISMDVLQKLTVTKSVIEETMRFYPPVWVMARKSVAEDEINGYHLPANSTVLINVYGMNHSAEYWDLPEIYNPTRFENKEQRHPFAYIPFGGGQRLCIGQLFAMMIMQTVICRLVQEFEFRIPPGFKPVTEPASTLRARGGIQLVVTHNSSI